MSQSLSPGLGWNGPAASLIVPSITHSVRSAITSSLRAVPAGVRFTRQLTASGRPCLAFSCAISVASSGGILAMMWASSNAVPPSGVTRSAWTLNLYMSPTVSRPW